MPESQTSKEVRRLTGQNIENVAQRTLREFASQRLQAVAEARTTQAPFVPPLVKLPQVTVLPVRPQAPVPVISTVNQGDPAVPQTLLEDAVYLDTADNLLYYTDIFTDGRKDAV